MLVHAHPDDESTATGATMAHYVADGAKVTLVTCTSGELGEVVTDDLAHLRGNPDALGEYRRGEIARALRELGDIEHHWLGGPGRFRDSGMAGQDSNTAEGAFAAADDGEVLRVMVELLRAQRPQVVITYDEIGGYGHPDHIAAHRAVMNAVGPAADPAFAPELGAPWDVSKVYWWVLSRSFFEQVRPEDMENFEEFTVRDEDITAALDGRKFHEAKLAALRTYRSQVNLDDNEFFATMVQNPAFAVETFVLARGERGPGSGPNNWESDLFAGLD
ncbi:N-acetyl-1-D-myo-inositol-2-amino-2-deoxy-alpha-D-glucopyranoside deacetylase [Saccharopolyspora taberi]|uniref:N-acetyl-1-D-myo-inositol-2-amino-2-deoxy-alpha-D-glucopyranoside deacetylase n=1 Tax=Saccharopolyspora taberi TaxID=60895 RepID=A0ABN3V451_9PSEU